MEILADHLKQLPLLMNLRLNELRRLDKQSRDASNELTLEENTLVAELQACKGISPEEEAIFVEKSLTLVKRRHEILSKIETQMKVVQNAYDQIDNKINYMDSCTKTILHLFPQSDEAGNDGRKKKKRKANTDTAEGFNEGGMFVDPNEPVYCTCRQVSYGQMIACENLECKTEWFHFACVGLTVEPADPWFCSECKVVPEQVEITKDVEE